MRRRGHLVQFYQNDDALLNTLDQRISAALHAGHAALVVASPEHRAGLRARLSARGMVPRPKGRLVMLGAAETLALFLRDQRPDPARFFEQVGGAVRRTAALGEDGGLFVFGEMVALLWGPAPAAAIELEQLWNQLGQREAFDLHCAYPMSCFDGLKPGHDITTICDTHTDVLPAESYSALTETTQRLRHVVELQRKAGALEHVSAAHNRERTRAERALQRLDVWQRLLDTECEERQRVARDLRERTQPVFTRLEEKLFLLRHGSQPPLSGEAAVLSEECLRLVDEARRAVNAVAHIVDPPGLQQDGLLGALRELCRTARHEPPPSIAVTLPAELPALTRAVEAALYRVAHEALDLLGNLGAAPTVALSLEADTELRLEVRAPSATLPSYLVHQIHCGEGAWGGSMAALTSYMQRLGGELRFESGIAASRVTATLPLNACADAALTDASADRAGDAPPPPVQ